MRVEPVGLSRAGPALAVAEQVRMSRQAVQVASVEGDANGWFRRVEGVALAESLVLTRLAVPAMGAQVGRSGDAVLPDSGLAPAGLWERVLELFGSADTLPDLAAMMAEAAGTEAAAGDETLQVMLLVLSYRARDAAGAPDAYRSADLALGALAPGALMDYSA